MILFKWKINAVRIINKLSRKLAVCGFAQIKYVSSKQSFVMSHELFNADLKENRYFRF